ncbi:MAG: TetR/AcrR family transcriptional regulator [Acidobacteria bacterium]|jgi:AcrR family transcriptional regulator|nr:TetR/AcrR family transcriptional regulator [Acidobacteriota bacterium]
MTRDRILEAAAHEIEVNGLTLFRVKRVAADAGISVALLYSYFSDREDLIAAAIVHRFRQVILGQADIFIQPLKGVSSAEELRRAMSTMIRDAQDPERTEQRLSRIDGISFAHHNAVASAGIAEAKSEASDLIAETVQPLEDQGFLVEGMTAVAFARIWYALFFGQIALEGQHALSIDSDAWNRALEVLAHSIVADTPR